MSNIISETLRDSFIVLIANRTGIEIRKQNYSTLGDNILSRIGTLNLSRPQDYLQLLAQNTDEADKEWQNFVCLLTNRESYFFRDKGQMNLLRQRILPDIIRANQRTKTIRICSAGCSTGQEPYSIAILLRELLPDIEEWQLKIVGIDINRESLEQGKRAMYNPWSFRQVEDRIKEEYFHNLAGYYKLHPSIKSLVRFHQVNLVQDRFHEINPDTQNLDLIICRNVFIYFTDQAISTVVEKFFDILKPNGYFIAGHAELQNHHTKTFKGHMFPESLVYTKQGHSVQTPQAPRYIPNSLIGQKKPSSIPDPVETKQTANQYFVFKPTIPSPATVEKKFPSPSPGANGDFSPDLTEIEDLVKQKAYGLALKKLEALHRQYSSDYFTCMLMAEVYANLGEYSQAKNWCEKSIDLDSFKLAPHYLLAKIAEEKNEIELAKQILKRIMYLDTKAIPAYLHLANIYQSQGDGDRCRKLQQSAMKVLGTMPPDSQFTELANITAQDLMTQFTPSI